MQILRVEANSENWFLIRLGKLMGSKIKGARPSAYDRFKKLIGFYSILAEKIAESPDAEPPDERGHRLEPVALASVAKMYGLVFDPQDSIWLSELDDDIGISPDGTELVDIEAGEVPTYAAEVKCLSSAKHIKYIMADLKARVMDDYNPIYSVPNEEQDHYRDQAVQYFVVNKKLKKLYYVFYDDRLTTGFEHLITYVIQINREDVEELIKEQENFEMDTLLEINETVAMLANLGESIHVRN